MLNQKQWKIQQLAERMNNVAYSIAAESARQTVKRQKLAKEQSIVADEARNIAVHLLTATEQNIFNNLPDDEFDKIVKEMMTRTMVIALNTAFISCKIPDLKPVAVFAEELLNLSNEMREVMCCTPMYMDIPAPFPRSRIIPGVFYLFRATTGDVIWCENAELVTEILQPFPDGIKNNRFVEKSKWRDLDIPYINFGDASDNPYVIIVKDANDNKKHYAVQVSIDALSLANSYVGVNKPYDGVIPVRECWAASDGGELIFPDWEKLT